MNSQPLAQLQSAGDENMPPQLQFEPAPLKEIYEAPRPTKRSYEDLVRSRSNPTEETTPAQTSKRARLTAWVAEQRQKSGACVAELRQKLKGKAPEAADKVAAPELHTNEETTPTAPISKRARLGAWVAEQRQKLKSKVPEAAEEAAALETQPEKQPLTAVMTDWFSSASAHSQTLASKASSQTQALASKLKPLSAKVTQDLKDFLRSVRRSPETVGAADKAAVEPVSEPVDVGMAAAPAPEEAAEVAPAEVAAEAAVEDAPEQGLSVVAPEETLEIEAEEDPEDWLQHLCRGGPEGMPAAAPEEPVEEVAEGMPANAFEAPGAWQGMQEEESEEEQWYAAPAPAAVPAAEAYNLPAPWQAYFNEDYGAYYYHNPLTGASQWEMPTTYQ